MDYKRADKRKHHYIYKTTCLVTGKWYIGLHSTDDLNDGYIGSGTYLARSIRKHGREQHTCEILEHYPTRDAVKLREAELVTWSEVELAECMNLVPGGQAGDGWQACNSKLTLTQRTKAGKAGGFANKHLWSSEQRDRVFTETAKHGAKAFEEFKASLSPAQFDELYTAARKKGGIAAATLESNAKRKTTMAARNHSQGKHNSQYGKRWNWVTKDGQPRRIQPDELESYLAQGYIRGKKDTPR